MKTEVGSRNTYIYSGGHKIPTAMFPNARCLAIYRSVQFPKYHTKNKCVNCMSFILNHFFKTLFTAPTCFDNISLIIIREHI